MNEQDLCFRLFMASPVLARVAGAMRIVPALVRCGFVTPTDPAELGREGALRVMEAYRIGEAARRAGFPDRPPYPEGSCAREWRRGWAAAEQGHGGTAAKERA